MLFLAREGVSDLIRQALEEYAVNHQLAVTDPKLQEAIALQAQEFARLGLEMEADDFLSAKTPQQKLLEIQQQLTAATAKPKPVKVATPKRAPVMPSPVAAMPISPPVKAATTPPPANQEAMAAMAVAQPSQATQAPPSLGGQEVKKPVKALDFGPPPVSTEAAPDEAPSDNFALTLLQRYSADEDQY